MDKRARERILLGACWTVMGAFVWFVFFSDPDEGTDPVLTNPSRLDESPSKTAILVEKRKRERRSFDLDRQVYTMDHFFATQVTRSPTDSTARLEPQPAPSDEGSRSQAEPRPVPEVSSSEPAIPKAAVTSKPSDSSQFRGKIRRAGFASGSQQNLPRAQPENPKGGSVLAVVHQETRVRSGSDIKLRLIEPLQIGAVAVPENTFVTGRVTLSQERIYVDVKSVAQDGDLIEADLTAFDLTGTRGIFVQGTQEIHSDALAGAVDQVQRRVDVPLLRDIPFSAAKKKVRQEEIILSAGHKMYLSHR